MFYRQARLRNFIFPVDEFCNCGAWALIPQYVAPVAAKAAGRLHPSCGIQAAAPDPIRKVE
jgi:hypothetical protein